MKLAEESIYDHGFARVAAVSVPVHLGDCEANANQTLAAAKECAAQGVALAVFPELGLSGYSISDLVGQRELLESAVAAVEKLVAESAVIPTVLVVGAPLKLGAVLYNCAVVVHRGRILGVQPKEHLPSYGEFYEERHYSTTPTLLTDPEVSWVRWEKGLSLPPDQELGSQKNQSARFENAGRQSPPHEMFPFGKFLVRVRDVPGLTLGVEVCEDVWVPVPPSSLAALSGATVIANLSASPVTVGRARSRQDLVKGQSFSSISAYVYTAAGFGESSDDLAWDGQTLIYEDGVKLASGPRFATQPVITTADVDLELLSRRRAHQTSFTQNGRKLGVRPPTVVETSLALPKDVADLRRPLARFPFIPDEPGRRDEDCFEAFAIQESALRKRMVSIGNPKLILGVSGGLDSTLALLVAVKAMDRLGRPRTDVVACTMPGFGTTAKTRTNAEILANALGVTFHEIDIRPAAKAMLEAMGHPYAKGEAVYDVTFENVQAGLRTDYLFRLAGSLGGFVVGTGDMSELALGWCTYGVGDQMSHYGVNAGIPKTMIQHLIRWVGENESFAGNLSGVLESILGTEISPELVPTGESGETQSTEAAIGPYELQDFTLYWLLRGGFTPGRIAYLQAHAWGEKYSDTQILRWLEVFFRRFFQNQYKRMAVPGAPKVMAAGSLSPRGDWRMPADALSTSWLEDIKAVRDRLGSHSSDGTLRA